MGAEPDRGLSGGVVSAGTVDTNMQTP